MKRQTWRSDGAALLSAIVLGALLGFLLTRLPGIYAFGWWVGAPTLTMVSCSLARRETMFLPTALAGQAAIFVSFSLNGGVRALESTLFHTFTLTPASRRQLWSDLLCTAFLAGATSVLAAASLKNSRRIQAAREHAAPDSG